MMARFFVLLRKSGSFAALRVTAYGE